MLVAAGQRHHRSRTRVDGLRTGLNGDVRQRLGPAIDAAQARHGGLVQVQGREEFFRRQAGLFQVAVPLPIPLRYGFPFRFQGGCGARQKDDRAAGRKIVPQGFGLLEEQRQVVLRSLRRHALAQLSEDFRARRVLRETPPESFPEGFDTVRVQRQFARRQEPERIQFSGAALRGGAEPADRFDLPVEELDSHRRRGAAGKNVQQSATNRIFSRLIDQRHPKIGRFVESSLEVVRIQFLPCTAAHAQPLAKLRARRQAVQQRGRGDEQCPRRSRRFPSQEARQGFQAPRGNLGMRAEQIVGQRFPVREQRHGAVASPQPRHLLHELLHASRLGRDDQDAWRRAGVNQAGADERRRARADAMQRKPRLAYIRQDNRPDCR